jgi:hypothetical protein
MAGDASIQADARTRTHTHTRKVNAIEAGNVNVHALL